MTSRECYLAVLHGARPDSVPRIPILRQFAAECIGSNYGAFASDHRVLVEANLRCAEDFDFDQVSTISDPYRETAAFCAPVEFVRDGVPICLNPALEDDPDPAKLPRADVLTSPRTRDRIDAVRLYRERVGDRYSVLGWIEGPAAEAADVRGVGNFLADLLEEPDRTFALMERCVESGIEFARAQVEAGADTIGIGDAVASQVSAQTYEAMILPLEQTQVAAVRTMGAYVRLRICGNITHLLPGIATLPINILDVDHPVDLAHAPRRRTGHRARGQCESRGEGHALDARRDARRRGALPCNRRDALQSQCLLRDPRRDPAGEPPRAVHANTGTVTLTTVSQRQDNYR